MQRKAPLTQAIFVAQLDATFVALCVASSKSRVQTTCDVAAAISPKSRTSLKLDATQSATKNASTCATKIACENGA